MIIPIDDLTALGQKMRESRKKKDLTQQELADLSHVSVKQIASIEKGQINPSYLILKALAKVLNLFDEIKPAATEEQIAGRERVLDFTLPAQVREFFLLTAGINVSTGVIVELSGTFNLTIHGERYCVLGEFWKEADGDQLLLRPGEETIWYYAHEQDKVKRLCNDMAELLEKKLARYLNEH